MDYSLQAVAPGRTRTAFSPDEFAARVGLFEADTDTLHACLAAHRERRGVDVLDERLGLVRQRTERLRTSSGTASRKGQWPESEHRLRVELDAIGHSLAQLSKQIDDVLSRDDDRNDPPAALERESGLLHAYLEELRVEADLAGKELRDVHDELAELATSSLRAVVERARAALAPGNA